MTEMIRKSGDSDGNCFASVAANEGCLILSVAGSECGTYDCPFYKPSNHRDWVRIDRLPLVWLIPKDEYFTDY